MIPMICETILIAIGTIVSMLSIAYCGFLLLEREGAFKMPAKEKYEFKKDDYRHDHVVFTDIKEKKK